MFLLFAGDFYYPNGGWEDFRGVYPTSDQAVIAVASMRKDWWHVVEIGIGIAPRVVKHEDND